MSERVLILGATGNVGRHVVGELVASGTHVRAHTRDAARAAEVIPGAELVEGELTDDLLEGAIDGVDAVFLLSAHGYAMGEGQLRVIRALRRSGVRIVKLSGTSSAITPDGPHACRQHWEVEQVLKASGQPFVILRPNSFMQVLIGQIMLPALSASGAIPNALGASGISLIDARDVAAVAARTLTSDAWDGETLVLTGPRAITYREIAGLVSEIRGEQVPVADITPADVRVAMLARGLQPWEAEHFEEMYQLFRDGESAFVTDTVERVTGAPPRTVEAYLAELAPSLKPVSA
ncbi:MAG: hypothetical protein JWN36_1465 [Microbacteriaceae bacterium]|nr:hypothetical protein [Microbacteriaceae bacterium]